MKKILVLICTFLMIANPVYVSFGVNSSLKRPLEGESIYSIWVKLSIMGFSQSEIESTLINVDTEKLKRVKHRLRLQVLNNLRKMNIKNEVALSTTVNDLNIISQKIHTEIRFAGLENDHHLIYMIKNQFGINMYN